MRKLSLFQHLYYNSRHNIHKSRLDQVEGISFIGVSTIATFNIITLSEILDLNSSHTEASTIRFLVILLGSLALLYRHTYCERDLILLVYREYDEPTKKKYKKYSYVYMIASFIIPFFL
jgi:hypothetical protein